MATIHPVATCRQTVEAFLATPTTAWQRMATIQAVTRRHLSPDGGSLPRHAYHRLASDGYHSGSEGIRQSVKLYALYRSNETNP